MPKIYSFSVPESEKQNTKLIAEVKTYCAKHRLNFSGVVVDLLKKWHEENVNGAR